MAAGDPADQGERAEAGGEPASDLQERGDLLRPAEPAAGQGRGAARGDPEAEEPVAGAAELPARAGLPEEYANYANYG